MDNWMEHEKEAYRQLDDYRLSALYSGNDIGEDPELRENFLLDFFKIDRRNYYNLITSQVNSLNANPNITSLSFLEGLFLIEIENAINN
tara:strand:+ start:235 stop:501 length:267 start_codon:yes stop_codon:yes gene_type:complete